ncbi:hypothetical protein ASG67_16920 [Sphingomonas sp. Leaf339]|uniref:hypothetical protein n=1 Tax=Sphingomonas sp. Leaf339 TaxID=1736343 RepID=UPI0006F4455C|nr:hypothetical protein [Sphingomonas sp. Leaf339]KQU58810.1 hypothetical protein ASG67_16920 [Sphingomonas sp. Leaf339]
MTAWHRSRRADLGLRASGLLLCAIAYTAVLRLSAMHISSQNAGAFAYAFAAICFLGASAGSALVMLGHHLFDEIEVSERWQPRSRDTFLPPENSKVMNTTEPALLVVGRDTDGSWTVRESAGAMLGRFPSAQAAERFAQGERRGRTAIAIATSAGFQPRIAGRLSLRNGGVRSPETADA